LSVPNSETALSVLTSEAKGQGASTEARTDWPWWGPRRHVWPPHTHSCSQSQLDRALMRCSRFSPRLNNNKTKTWQNYIMVTTWVDTQNF